MAKVKDSKIFEVYVISWWFETNLLNVMYEIGYLICVVGFIPRMHRKLVSQVDITALVVSWFGPVFK